MAARAACKIRTISSVFPTPASFCFFFCHPLANRHGKGNQGRQRLGCPFGSEHPRSAWVAPCTAWLPYPKQACLSRPLACAWAPLSTRKPGNCFLLLPHWLPFWGGGLPTHPPSQGRFFYFFLNSFPTQNATHPHLAWPCRQGGAKPYPTGRNGRRRAKPPNHRSLISPVSLSSSSQCAGAAPRNQE